ncbi:8385_t:CDS:2 [Funneliformis geosporum]|nr:8385_t:CDS:2 [Funneliformis geosporum]
MLLYDLYINPSNTKREYVTFWNPLTNTCIYEQIIRKYPHIKIADICYFNLITNDMGLESLVKCPNCFLNSKKKCMSKVPFQNIVKIDIIGKKQHQKVKGYSGDIYDIYNNIADNLAKSGIQSPEISINYLNVPFITCLFQFNDIIIESSVRLFTKNIFATTAVSNIIDLHRNDDLKSLTR